MRRRTLAVSIVAAAALVVVGKLSLASADADEEKPIVSAAARVSRDAAGHVEIAIAPGAQKVIGLTVETLRPVVQTIEVPAYGFVLDPLPLSKLSSDLLSAQAALDASDAQYRRAKQLYAEQKNVSLRDLQIAQTAYLTDKVRFQTLQQQLRDGWGAEIAQKDARARGELVSALISRREALARVTAPIGEQLDGSPRGADVYVLGHEQQPLTARAIHEAPTVDPRMQGQSFLLLISADMFPIRPGTAVSARLATSDKAKGVMVSRSAVVRYAGAEWVYREAKSDVFTRLEIFPAQLTGAGYFVTQGLRPGTRIVVTGAQTLLSEEMKSAIQPSD
jgi:hypothetical protein